MKHRPQHLQALIDRANRMLSDSTCSAETRQGIIGLLEGMLHAAHAYHGFRYLEIDEVPQGCLPGIRRFDGAASVFPDETRRHYI